jgi:uncharacterized membrane protein (UPF0127 family)
MTAVKFRATALLVALLVGAVASAQTGPQKLASIRLNAGIHNIQAEVARTPDERATGLMFLLPLAVAFIADDGSIVNIDEMKPQTLDSHCSTKPVRYVLEMNAGWFAKRGITPGTRLRGAPFGS